MASQVNTARSVEVIDRFAFVHEFSGNLRQCQPADIPNGIAPRRFNSDVSAAYQSLEVGGRYRALLSADCSTNQMLHIAANGRLTPVGGGVQVGRARSAGSNGSIVEITYEPPTGSIVGGQVELTYNKQTSTAPDNTPRTAADWPNGNPPLNALLEIEFLPTNRNRRELYRWTGGPNWLQQLDNLVIVAAPSHGLDLTTVEGERVPVGWHWDGASASRAPADIGEFNHCAISAPDANSLVLRTIADMEGRTYSEVSNPVGGLGETLYWDQATNTHVQAENELRLFQVDAVDSNMIKFHFEDTRSTTIQNTTTSTVIDSDVWLYTAAADVDAGTLIPIAEFIAGPDTTGSAPLADLLTDAEIEIDMGVSGRSHIVTSTASGITLDFDIALGNTIEIRRQRLV